LLASPLPLFAGNSASSIPQGYVEITIPAGDPSAPSVATFSIPTNLIPSPDFVGKASGFIDSVTQNTIFSDKAEWEAGALSLPSAPYFVRITSGAATGLTFQISTTEANTSSTLTVLTQGLDLTKLGIAGGDTYKIFPGDTLASFFGTSTQGGTSAATADNVNIFTDGVWRVFYYHSTSGQWREGSLPINRNNMVLRPDWGITFYRRGDTPLRYVLLGETPSTDVKIVVNNHGPTYIGGVFPVDETLGTSGLESSPLWVKSGDSGEASTLNVWDGSVWRNYNYSASSGQWREGSLPVNRNNVLLPAGTPLIVNLWGDNEGVSILNRTLPYSLD